MVTFACSGQTCVGCNTVKINCYKFDRALSVDMGKSKKSSRLLNVQD